MAEQITFEVTGLKELGDRLNQGDSIMRVTLNDGLRKIGHLFVPAKGTGPLADETPKRSGKLARSTFFQIIGGTLDQMLLIMQPARNQVGDFYGWFVREGTAPHIIRPRKARALRFEIEGEVVFAMIVHHPGTKPNPYHKRVLAMLMGEVQIIVNEMGERVTAYLAGG